MASSTGFKYLVTITTMTVITIGYTQVYRPWAAKRIIDPIVEGEEMKFPRRTSMMETIRRRHELSPKERILTVDIDYEQAIGGTPRDPVRNDFEMLDREEAQRK